MSLQNRTPAQKIGVMKEKILSLMSGAMIILNTCGI